MSYEPNMSILLLILMILIAFLWVTGAWRKRWEDSVH